MLENMPAYAEFKDFYQQFVPLLNKYSTNSTEQTHNVLARLQVSTVYKWLIKECNFNAALDCFITDIAKDTSFIGHKYKKKPISDDFIAMTLMCLFSRAYAKLWTTQNISSDQKTTVSKKLFGQLADKLREVNDILDDEALLFPKDVIALQQMTIGMVAHALDNPYFYSMPQRSSGQDLLHFKHFIYYLIYNYMSVLQVRRESTRKIILNLTYILSEDNERIFEVWFNEAYKAYSRMMKSLAFIKTDTFNISKYGFIANLR